MTLIAACLTKYDCLMSADRLLTLQLPSGRFAGEHDSLSNKNIVCVADDGVAVLGYTGSAYINGIPTDQFIAECLYDESLPSETFMGNRSRVLGGSVSDRIFSLRRRTALDWNSGFVRVLAAGFREYRGFLVPYIITFDLGQKDFGGPRMRLRMPYSPGLKLAFSSVGAELSKQEVDLAYSASTIFHLGPDHKSIADFLIDLTRRKAALDRTVGRDVMLLHVDAHNRLVSCKFNSDRRYEHNSAPQLTDETQSVAFTPWVIGRSSFVAPSLITASQPLEVRVGSWTAHLYGAEPEEGRLRPTIMFSGQSRKPPPRGQK